MKQPHKTEEVFSTVGPLDLETALRDIPSQIEKLLQAKLGDGFTRVSRMYTKWHNINVNKESTLEFSARVVYVEEVGRPVRKVNWVLNQSNQNVIQGTWEHHKEDKNGIQESQ